MASLQMDYFPENFVFLQGIKYNYARPAVVKPSGTQAKEFYRCEFCYALLSVQKGTLTCQLLSNHTDKRCNEARSNWIKIRQMKAQNGLCKRLELVETVPKLVAAKAADTTIETGEEDGERSGSCNLNDALMMSPSSDEADFSSIVATVEVTPVTLPKKKKTKAGKKTTAESSVRPLANHNYSSGSTQNAGAGPSQPKEEKPFKYFDDSMSPTQLRKHYMSQKYFDDSE